MQRTETPVCTLVACMNESRVPCRFPLTNLAPLLALPCHKHAGVQVCPLHAWQAGIVYVVNFSTVVRHLVLLRAIAVSRLLKDGEDGSK